MSALRNILMDRKQKSDRLAGIDSPSKVGTPVRTSQANNKGKNKTAYVHNTQTLKRAIG